METFSALLAICAGNSPVTGGFRAQRPVTRSFDVFFDQHQNKGWVNSREAGDLRRHRAHHYVIAMKSRPYIESENRDRKLNPQIELENRVRIFDS